MARRPLNPKFIETMRLYDGWPRDSDFKDWLRTDDAPPVCNGIKSGVYGEMKQGFAVASHITVGLSAYFQHCLRQNEATGCHAKQPDFCKAFLKFLSQFPEVDPRIVSAQELATVILAEGEPDYMAKEFGALEDLLRLNFLIRDPAVECVKESDVREAIRWMFVFCGRALRSDNHALSPRDAESAASKHFHISLDEYQDRGMSWWHFDRWTVVFARGRRSLTGMSIVLPLREHVYQEMRAGRRMGFDVAPDELVRPSNFVLIEGAAERPTDIPSESDDVTKFTLNATLTQVAALSHAPGHDTDQTLNSLSFGPTPRSTYRLRGAGYKPLGTHMPIGSIAFYEKQLARHPSTYKDHLARNYLIGVGDHVGKMLRPPRWSK